jgi:hypothetical protein
MCAGHDGATAQAANRVSVETGTATKPSDAHPASTGSDPSASECLLRRRPALALRSLHPPMPGKRRDPAPALRLRARGEDERLTAGAGAGILGGGSPVPRTGVGLNAEDAVARRPSDGQGTDLASRLVREAHVRLVWITASTACSQPPSSFSKLVLLVSNERHRWLAVNNSRVMV